MQATREKSEESNGRVQVPKKGVLAAKFYEERGKPGQPERQLLQQRMS